jgi:chromosome segregation ATPase
MFINFNRKLFEEVSEGGEGEGAASDAPSVDELQAQIESLTNERDSMKSKMDELLGEAKRAKSQRREAEEAARLAAEEKAKKAGDFEQLHKSSEEARAKLQQELEDLRNGIANEKRSNEAMRIAGGLAEGANAEILSRFIAERLKYTDEGIKVLDESGQLTVSTVEDLTNEFRNNAKFSALLKGNQSSGGSATGGNSSGAAGKTMTRADFDNLSAEKRMEFIKSGGKTVDH